MQSISPSFSPHFPILCVVQKKRGEVSAQGIQYKRGWRRESYKRATVAVLLLLIRCYLLIFFSNEIWFFYTNKNEEQEGISCQISPGAAAGAAAPRSPGEAAVTSAPFLNSGHLGTPSTSTNHKLYLVHALNTCAEDSD